MPEAGLVGGTPAGGQLRSAPQNAPTGISASLFHLPDNPQDAIRVRANDHAVAIYKGGPNNSNEPRETRRPDPNDAGSTNVGGGVSVLVPMVNEGAPRLFREGCLGQMIALIIAK